MCNFCQRKILNQDNPFETNAICIQRKLDLMFDGTIMIRVESGTFEMLHLIYDINYLETDEKSFFFDCP